MRPLHRTPLYNQSSILPAKFESKPMMFFVSLAFGSFLFVQETHAATNKLELTGHYDQSLFVNQQGLAGSKPGSTGFDASKINGKSGSPVWLATIGATEIDNTKNVDQAALMVKTNGGDGGAHEGNGSSLVGGKGGNGGKIDVQLQEADLKIKAQGQGLVLDSHGGHAGNNTKGNDTSKADHATAGVGGDVMMDTHGHLLDIRTHGKQSHAMAINARGGNGATGRYDNSNPFWTSANPGSDGGRGGSITIQANGQTLLNANGEGSNAITIKTDGGNGGHVGLGGSSVKAGNGGNGGKQNISLGSEQNASSQVQTQGANAVAISMRSVAGNGGSVHSGSNIFHTKTPGHGGHGGDFSLDVSNTQIKTQGQNSHAVLLSTEGGFGGSGVSGSSRAGDGGHGGEIAVKLDQSSSICSGQAAQDTFI